MGRCFGTPEPALAGYSLDGFYYPHVEAGLSPFGGETIRSISLYYNSCYIYTWTGECGSSHGNFVEKIGIVRKIRTIGSTGIIHKNLNTGLVAIQGIEERRTMTQSTLEKHTCKDLIEMAREQGVTGWHSMRKEQLIRALLSAAKAKSNRNAARAASLRDAGPQRSKSGFSPAERTLRIKSQQ